MAKPPRFCKILIDDYLQDGKLRIPKKFARIYGNYLSGKVFLKVSSDDKWEIELVKNGDGIWFGKGWKNCVDYYSLSHGSFLVFEVEDFKTSSFYVVIFGKSASEIHYPCHVNGDNEEPNVEEQVKKMRISKDKTPLPYSRPSRKMKQEKLVHSFSGHGIGKKMEQGSGSRVPREKKGNRDDLSFSIVMKPTHLIDGDFRVVIPYSFAERYLKNWRGILTLVHSEDGKPWSVNYVSLNIKNRKVVRLCCLGWKKFAVANHLEIGDICFFEAIDHNPNALQVVIWRGN